MFPRTFSLAAALVLTLSAVPAVAQSPDAHAGHHASAPANAWSEGTVRKVDTAAGKLTLAHGPIANLGMPPMTMVFRVADPAMLARVQAGARVRFTVEQVGGAYTVTALEPTGP